MRSVHVLAAVLAIGAGGAALAASKPATKPAARPAAPAAAPGRGPAVYWMSASTSTGMGGAGGRPNMAAMMSGAYNPNAVTHTLMLQLGSPRRPDGDPSAEHVPPPELRAGPSLPLLTPVSRPVESGPPMPYQRPEGRMLIFWGCGEHAGPGQPVVIDYAKLGQGQGGAQMASLMAAYGNLGGNPPAPGRFTTYGEWPNERARTVVPGDGSLTGAHLIRGNYTPDINFSMTPNQDFLPPFQLTNNAATPSGANALAWRRVDGAQAYFANMIGSSGGNTVVMWTSSQVQASGFGMPEYLTSGDIDRLTASHVLMPAATLSCTIPAEAIRAAGQGGMFNLVAYGDEANFVYPPKPADPKAAWSPIWTVKVRYRSATSGVLGMNMADMGNSARDNAGGDDDEDQPQPQPQPKRRPSGIPGLGGVWP
ncbi:MAG TPA: hypothetical protein VFE03_09060 [Caulobacteraceae bacterium]|jgi:hypothetical protein|nr:hypothetical protein [Caulobacteraceae bacterium]